MTAVVLALVVLSLIALAVWLDRRLARDAYGRVSRAWVDNHDRTAHYQGIDQSSVSQWPIRKRENDLGTWNAKRFRKRA